jgi:hypothetical protein
MTMKFVPAWQPEFVNNLSVLLLGEWLRVLCCCRHCRWCCLGCFAGVYVWSVGSFDVFGVHPVSSSSQGTFADPAIIAMAKKQNGKA